MERIGTAIGTVIGAVLGIGTWVVAWQHAPRFVVINLGLGLAIIAAVAIGEQVSKRRTAAKR